MVSSAKSERWAHGAEEAAARDVQMSRKNWQWCRAIRDLNQCSCWSQRLQAGRDQEPRPIQRSPVKQWCMQSIATRSFASTTWHVPLLDKVTERRQLVSAYEVVFLNEGYVMLEGGV